MSPSLEASSPQETHTLSTEVHVAPRSKRYSAAFKQRLLDEADACVAPGALGALLRREGLYFSTLADFRKQKARRDRDSPHPPALPKEALAPHGVKELAASEREVRRLRRELACAANSPVPPPCSNSKKKFPTSWGWRWHPETNPRHAHRAARRDRALGGHCQGVCGAGDRTRYLLPPAPSQTPGAASS